ncbi:unnamed protein product [Paramecium pentaurelia]|uniref:3'-5' exonuclease domain-containing protein n=1 Tax=Paramecium pentaurelia TaxID=43138 RepID=A0A8S1WD15_9CILI|nr:unnamed protein product [Paramecium pentaurelia]
MYINYENLLPKLQGQAFGIDIEFSKKKIFLIQISDGNQIYLFDPIALNLEQYLRDFFQNDAIKIFYSCAQDLKWLIKQYKIIVNNYCDLQVLAQKEPDQSLIALWKNDWLARPLAEEQLYQLTQIKDKLKKQSKNLHGETVVKKLDTDEKIKEFIMIFRKHFLLSMNPQFLPKEWAIDHQFIRNFGEFSCVLLEVRIK